MVCEFVISMSVGLSESEQVFVLCAGHAINVSSTQTACRKKLKWYLRLGEMTVKKLGFLLTFYNAWLCLKQHIFSTYYKRRLVKSNPFQEIENRSAYNPRYRNAFDI